MATTPGKKTGYAILQTLGAFFDKKLVPPWIPWAVFGGIAVLIAWANNWDWWYLLRIVSVILWILFAIIMIMIFVRRSQNAKKAGGAKSSKLKNFFN